MKKMIFIFAVLLSTITSFAQFVEYGDNMELNEALSPNQTVEYRALHSITLLPGFHSISEENNSVLLKIGPGYGINDNNIKPNLVYPVPAKNQLNIQISEMCAEPYFIAVFDAKGMKCLDSEVGQTGNLITLDIHNLDAGLYIYKEVSESQEVTSGKFIKE